MGGFGAWKESDMAKFRWLAGNQGFYRYTELQDFDLVSTTATKMVLQFNGDTGALDPLVQAGRVEITYRGRTTFTPEEGPNAGVPVVNGGTVAALRYYSESGKLLLEVTQLARPLAPLVTLLAADPSAVFDYLTAGPNSYTGSGNSGAPNWDGDTIATGFGHDTVMAGAGDDYIVDMGGADDYRGGAGFDELSYDESYWSQINVVSGIVADLAKGTVTGPDGLTDKVAGIERLRGTFLADSFVGDGKDNRFAGLAGADTIDGGAGFDTITHRHDASQGGTAGVRVNLTKGTARDGFGNFDKLKNIEGAEGSDTRDIFTDNAGDNWLRGLAGNDEFRIGRGNDTLRGDAGADYFVFSGKGFGNDVIEDFDYGLGDRIKFAAGGSFTDLSFAADGDDTIVTYFNASIRLVGLSPDEVAEPFFLF